jgi:hypothetical protein
VGTAAWDGTVYDVNDPSVFGGRLNESSQQKDFQGRIGKAVFYRRALAPSGIGSLLGTAGLESPQCGQ